MRDKRRGGRETLVEERAVIADASPRTLEVKEEEVTLLWFLPWLMPARAAGTSLARTSD